MSCNFDKENNWVVIVAGGNATRFGKDKLLTEWLGKPLILHTIENAKSACKNVVVVASKENVAEFKALIGDNVLFATGGETRTQSVKNGLAVLPDTAKLVAIHDGARPFASRELYARLFESAKVYGSAIPAVKATDTTYDISCATPRTIDRSNLINAQTPQVFDFARLKKAYEKSPQETDDGQVWLNAYGE